MTNTTTLRPAADPSGSAASRPRAGQDHLPARGAWLRRHAASLRWLAPILMLSVVVQCINLAGSPVRTDDEGTYVAQAWALSNLGELAHYTYWYDHPPLGWVQLAAYTELTDAFNRWGLAVLAGREAMVVATLISAVLVWALARRFGLARPAAAAAVLIFTLSPLAVQFHRTVYLDNIAVPWLLAAFLLAKSPRHQLAGFAASAATFGVAVLTKETALLALPFLILTMALQAHRNTRRYTMSVAGCVLVLIGTSYLLFAAIKGEILPGENRVSLVSGMMFQLVSRESGGSIFEPGSETFRTFATWWNLDPVLLIAGAAAAAAALVLLPPFRPVAALVLFHFLVMLRPDSYLPVPFVIVILPFLALVLAAIGQAAVRGIGDNTGARRLVPVVLGLGLATALTAAVPPWSAGLQRLSTSQADQPSVDAQRWVKANIARDNRLIVDDIMWVDLVKAGFPRSNVIWHYKLDTDEEVARQSPRGWRDSDYVVTTEAMRASGDLAQVQEAIENSEAVASFGQGTEKVEVRKVYPEGIEERQQEVQSTEEINASIGERLVADPRLETNEEVRGLLMEGDADPRILLALRQKLSDSTIGVADLPVLDGEDRSQPRQLVVSTLNGRPAAPGSDTAAEVISWATSLPAPLTPAAVSEGPGGVLITLPVLAPTYLSTE